MRTLLALPVILISFVLVSSPAHTESATYGVLVENDTLGGTDRNYTNGFALSYMGAEDNVWPIMRTLASKVPYVDSDNLSLRQGLVFSHAMYTPQDISTPTPDPNDHPYASSLKLGFLVNARKGDHTLSTAMLDIGIVGPSAQGEWLQDNVHNLINVQRPKGWDHQLHDEPILNLTFERKHAWRHDLETPISPMQWEWGSSMGGAVGNERTYASLGGYARIGPQLGRDFGPPRVRPGLSGTAVFDNPSDVNWYLFAGLEGRAVARDIYLDGNSFRDSASVDKKPFLGEAQAGVVVQFGQAQVSLGYVWRSKTFKGQQEAHQFGAISLLLKR